MGQGFLSQFPWMQDKAPQEGVSPTLGSPDFLTSADSWGLRQSSCAQNIRLGLVVVETDHQYPPILNIATPGTSHNIWILTRNQDVLDTVQWAMATIFPGVLSGKIKFLIQMFHSFPFLIVRETEDRNS